MPVEYEQECYYMSSLPTLPDPYYTCTQWEVEATARRDPLGDQLLVRVRGVGEGEAGEEDDEGKRKRRDD